MELANRHMGPDVLVQAVLLSTVPFVCVPNVLEDPTQPDAPAPDAASSTSLFMSTEESATEEPAAEEPVVEEPVAEVAATEEIPTEVVSLDGIASEEEAHNADRPARGSGTSKHKKAPGAGLKLSDLEPGATVQGTVKGITSYGAFLDIGSQTDALLHVSRMSDDFVANVEDVVKKGDVVSVRIVSIDLEKSQVAVTMRSEEAEARGAERGSGGNRKERPRRSGGDRSAQRATLNALAEAGHDQEKFVEGEVVSTLDFGAFVRFDASQLGESITGELDGLVHISSLAAGRVENVSDIAKVGDKVQIRVKNVDAEGGKVALSMISVADEPAPRGKRPRRRAKSMFSDDEMGAKDWKESMEKFSEDQPSFTNIAVVSETK
eukprot:CAMPEP_0197840240 /NCGR_PEP_ID=MMETSP1437-20131217/45491_1 /TAXON_ID=49252 ORGANISM="Eucampia antarctica, Strain CCMP1452" /NCGR_SAMPLE_ID=MMETSP1437 /ASSEMBLY_ACC=CAM_ASM_001096 /LENGTH=377 /DNA_ID=CAMNT_0043449819 /DNA_START=728 /DNA_END=1860 /DNA_ORIENTATION=-